ncbi:MAG: hypothetical protein AAGA48_28905 [Myxococcota bacterium]
MQSLLFRTIILGYLAAACVEPPINETETSGEDTRPTDSQTADTMDTNGCLPGIFDQSNFDQACFQ